MKLPITLVVKIDKLDAVYTSLISSLLDNFDARLDDDVFFNHIRLGRRSEEYLTEFSTPSVNICWNFSKGKRRVVWRGRIEK